MFKYFFNSSIETEINKSTTPIKACGASFTSSPYDKCDECQDNIKNKITNRDENIDKINNTMDKEIYKLETNRRLSLEILAHKNYHVLVGTEENKNFLETIDGLTINKNKFY